jgi:RNA polymerase primary sigma factor
MMSASCPTARRASAGSPAIDSIQLRSDRLLSAAEECELAGAIAGGNAEARDKLVRCNLRLVVRIALAYRGRGLELDDLIGEGNLGLIRAAVDYDPRFGARFSTYANYWIKQAIRAALTDTAPTIRLPSHMVTLLSKWRKSEQTLRLCGTVTGRIL